MTADHLDQVVAFLDHHEAQPWSDTVLLRSDDPDVPDLNVGDLRALAAEVGQLRSARTFLDGQVFVAGWYAHAEACASLGWDTREAAWRKCREEMAETLAKAGTAPQQRVTTDGGAE